MLIGLPTTDTQPCPACELQERTTGGLPDGVSRIRPDLAVPPGPCQACSGTGRVPAEIVFRPSHVTAIRQRMDPDVVPGVSVLEFANGHRADIAGDLRAIAREVANGMAREAAEDQRTRVEALHELQQEARRKGGGLVTPGL